MQLGLILIFSYKTFADKSIDSESYIMMKFYAQVVILLAITLSSQVASAALSSPTITEASAFLTFTNDTTGTYKDNEIFVCFNGPIDGTINGTTETISLMTSYTLKKLKPGIIVKSMGGRIYIAQGMDFQKNSQNNNVITPNFPFQNTKHKSSYKISSFLSAFPSDKALSALAIQSL